MFDIPIEHDQYGHISKETHALARRVAAKHGIRPGVEVQCVEKFSFGTIKRNLRVERVEAAWPGTVKVVVRNTATSRLSGWKLARIVGLLT